MRAVLLVSLLGFTLLGLLDQEAGLGTWFELRGEFHAAQARIDRLNREVETLRADVEALRGDPFALERAIREDLELSKPGEVIVRFTRARRSHPSPRFP